MYRARKEHDNTIAQISRIHERLILLYEKGEYQEVLDAVYQLPEGAAKCDGGYSPYKLSEIFKTGTAAASRINSNAIRKMFYTYSSVIAKLGPNAYIDILYNALNYIMSDIDYIEGRQAIENIFSVSIDYGIMKTMIKELDPGVVTLENYGFVHSLNIVLDNIQDDDIVDNFIHYMSELRILDKYINM